MRNGLPPTRGISAPHAGRLRGSTQIARFRHLTGSQAEGQPIGHIGGYSRSSQSPDRVRPACERGPGIREQSSRTWCSRCTYIVASVLERNSWWHCGVRRHDGGIVHIVVRLL
jgi:hypothetical protein